MTIHPPQPGRAQRAATGCAFQSWARSWEGPSQKSSAAGAAAQLLILRSSLWKHPCTIISTHKTAAQPQLQCFFSPAISSTHRTAAHPQLQHSIDSHQHPKHTISCSAVNEVDKCLPGSGTCFCLLRQRMMTAVGMESPPVSEPLSHASLSVIWSRHKQ